MIFYNLATLTRVNIASLNGSEGTGGNIVQIKKVSNHQGEEYAYISGQALRRYLKETLQQFDERITGVMEKGEPDFGALNEEIYGSKTKFEAFANKQLMFETFCDLDLFGYMMPKGDRRWSPVKVAPMLSLLPYRGTYDYLTRKDKSEVGKRSGEIVQVEIDVLNFMRGNIVVDFDKIGADVDEYSYELTPLLTEEQKKTRFNHLLDAIKCLNGGAKRSRHLEDLAPVFVVGMKQRTGNPYLLNAISVDVDGRLEVESILEALSDYDSYTDDVVVGIKTGLFSNEESVLEAFEKAGYAVTSVGAAIDRLKVE